jgi:hypothetical protein
MNGDWDYYEMCLNYINLIRDGFVSLDDVSDVDWHAMNAILRQEAFEKELLEDHAKAGEDFFGKKNK